MQIIKLYLGRNIQIYDKLLKNPPDTKLKSLVILTFK